MWTGTDKRGSEVRRTLLVNKDPSLGQVNRSSHQDRPERGVGRSQVSLVECQDLPRKS